MSQAEKHDGAAISAPTPSPAPSPSALIVAELKETSAMNGTPATGVDHRRRLLPCVLL
ncbi:MAG: hypothetical protein QM607_10925 [Microbacterium sp.]